MGDTYDITPLLRAAYERGALTAEYDYSQPLGLIALKIDGEHVYDVPIRSLLRAGDTASVHFPAVDGKKAFSVEAPR